jgi:uncharacterized protein (DUF1697 family)
VATRFVALLRGINVGHNKRVAMAELRELLANLGYSDVKTHLQSGNAVFSSPSPRADAVAVKVEAALMRDLGVQSTVIMRTPAELAAVVKRNPLKNVANDPARYLVGFLGGDPDAAGARAIGELEVAPDQVRLVDREIYLWCPSGILASPLSKVNLDQQLGVAVTMRNWNTVLKLAALAGAD